MNIVGHADGSPVEARNTAHARVWTSQSVPLLPADIADGLAARGIVAGFEPEDPETGETRETLTIAGLADAAFTVGGVAFRVQNLSSGRGLGCRVLVETCDASSLPDDYIARKTVPRPKLLYILHGGGPSNSDRALVEHIAEYLLTATEGIAEISGLGTKGNKPRLYARQWLGETPM